jgi:Cys-tRNA(Pro)/Cys-tRNA(Cys) deacylase
MLSNNVTRFLNQRKISYTLHALNTDKKLSAIEVSDILKQPEAMIYKTIILSGSEKSKPIAAVVSAQTKVDLKKLANFVQEKKVMPLSLEKTEEITGMKTGGISPIGLINKPFRIIMDDSINSLSTVIISAGVRGWQVELSPADLIQLCNAQTKPISTLN